MSRPSHSRSFGLLAALVLAAVIAAPVAAAKPTRIVIPFGTPEDNAETSAAMSGFCGFPVVATTDHGHLIIHLFQKASGVVQINNYNTVRLVLLNPANGKRVVVRTDAGPDITRVRPDGTVTIEIMGRSVTGSGYAGRVVINLTTGEVTTHGKLLGDFWADLCPALA